MQSILAASREWGSVKVIIYINEEEQYPINTLRNLVRDHANTLSIFAIDVDFIPGINLYEYLKINVIPFLMQTDSSLVVVPHFETWPCRETEGQGQASQKEVRK